MVKGQAALSVENILVVPPETPSEAIVSTIFVNTAVGLGDQPTGGNKEPGHVIGIFNELMVNANTDLAFGQEYRIDPRSNTLKQYVATKHVIGPDDQNGGTIGTYVLEQLDNMVGPVQNVSSFQRNYLDPRLVTTDLGGNVIGTEQITANRTLTKRDSGKHFMVISSTPVTVTFGPDVTAGCHFNFIQGGAGAINFAVSPDKAWYAIGNRTATNGLVSGCSVKVYPYGATVGTFNLLP